MDFNDISALLVASAAILGPVLAYFASKRAQRDSTQLATGAAKVAENTQQLDSWKSLVQQHDADAKTAREVAATAEKREDDERKKRIAAEDKASALQLELARLTGEFVTLQGVVVTQVAAVAERFPELPDGPRPIEGSVRESPHE